MFDTELAINEFQIGVFEKVFADVSDDRLYAPGSGHGHPPVWIAGHLAAVGEFGQQMLGGEPVHPEWGALFGPGSSDVIDPSVGIGKGTLYEAVIAAYGGLRERSLSADPAVLDAPHGIPFFRNTPLKTVRHTIGVLLTNHFGFHLAQLSSCRREAGGKPLF